MGNQAFARPSGADLFVNNEWMGLRIAFDPGNGLRLHWHYSELNIFVVELFANCLKLNASCFRSGTSYFFTTFG